MQLARFTIVALLSGGLALAAVQWIEPEKRIGLPTATATVEMRVVPRFAPTTDAVRRQMISNEALATVWDQLHRPAAESDELSEAGKKERETEIAAWRKYLEVEIEPNFVDDRRRVRISWTGANRPEVAVEIVQALACRYAGELEAERWYVSVDPLRTAEELVARTSRELLDCVHGATTGNKSASLSFPPPSAPLAAAAAAPRATIVQVEAVEEAGAPKLIAAGGPEILVAERPTAAPVAAPVEARAPSPKLLEAEQQFTAATSEMRRQMNQLLLPKNAEFPVVAAGVTGLSVWQSHSLWVGLACVLGLATAGVVEAVMRKPVAAFAGAPTSDAAGLRQSAEREPTAEEAQREPEIIRTSIDAQRAVKAPVIGVIRRSV